MLNLPSPQPPIFVHCKQCIQNLVRYRSTPVLAIAILDCERSPFKRYGFEFATITYGRYLEF